MSRKKDTTEQKTYELSKEEIQRITARFLTPSGEDEEIADFLLLLKACVYPTDEVMREDVLLYAEETAMGFSRAACDSLKEMVNSRYRIIRKGARR
jgi:hypothetical protein